MTEFVPAKRGDIAVFATKHSATMAFHLSGGTTHYERVRVGIVSSVSREGFVKLADSVASTGERFAKAFREIRAPQLVRRDRHRKPAAEIIAEVGDDFASLEEAREALRPFVKTDEELRLEAMPSRVREVIHRCRRGELLRKTFRSKEGGGTKILFDFHPSNATTGPDSAEAAIASGFLAPQRDGLFDEATSQTWRAA
jgi:hypothetical protein